MSGWLSLGLDNWLDGLLFLTPEAIFVNILINFDSLCCPHFSSPTSIGLACLLWIVLVGIILVLLLRVWGILLVSVLVLLAEGSLRLVGVRIVVLIILLVVVCLVVLIVIVRILRLLIRGCLLCRRS